MKEHPTQSQISRKLFRFPQIFDFRLNLRFKFSDENEEFESDGMEDESDILRHILTLLEDSKKSKSESKVDFDYDTDAAESTNEKSSKDEGDDVSETEIGGSEFLQNSQDTKSSNAAKSVNENVGQSAAFSQTALCFSVPHAKLPIHTAVPN